MEVDLNSGLKYIRKDIDEQSKNYQDGIELISAMMPEMANGKLCPVKALCTYLTKLHLRCNDLWQQVKEEEHLKDADIWFKP